MRARDSEGIPTWVLCLITFIVAFVVTLAMSGCSSVSTPQPSNLPTIVDATQLPLDEDIDWSQVKILEVVRAELGGPFSGDMIVVKYSYKDIQNKTIYVSENDYNEEMVRRSIANSIAREQMFKKDRQEYQKWMEDTGMIKVPKTPTPSYSDTDQKRP